ncbi:hypothetical protein BpHYR1_003759 [Brachionus plicatilis]|uniref:Uncharacterized protein n=1 Tax=Brachionus plicatilis TaxID=10195 RepID=A0A3M7SPB7_BRAPC|nr:hypothetical protein BpHYR1_003759 [Brachionus plicatilis]
MRQQFHKINKQVQLGLQINIAYLLKQIFTYEKKFKDFQDKTKFLLYYSRRLEIKTKLQLTKNTLFMTLDIMHKRTMYHLNI